MTEEKITLDKEVFKTLASGTRVDILKSLDVRRKTLSELSKQFGMSVSTVKEHLENLVSVGLIEQMDEGH
ncbi:MAG: helix-turn-helix transcriptional regulator [Candidatus Aenigmatarchaeota archaeon]|nr:MAG: helix-turn-helix transcriptional regulator [Candidatus Aenigmarchaeota archaeon]